MHRVVVEPQERQRPKERAIDPKVCRRIQLSHAPIRRRIAHFDIGAVLGIVIHERQREIPDGRYPKDDPRQQQPMCPSPSRDKQGQLGGEEKLADVKRFLPGKKRAAKTMQIYASPHEHVRRGAGSHLPLEDVDCVSDVVGERAE